MKHRCPWIPLAVVLLTLGAGFPVAGEIDARQSDQVEANEDTQMFLVVLTRYFERESDEVSRCLDLCDQPDDLAVTLFLANLTDRSPEFLLTLRNQNLGWWEISQGMGVDPDVWFLPVKYVAKPPFSQAYGHWEKSKETDLPLVLTDDECRHLVAARVLHDCYGVTVARAMELCATGRGLLELNAQEYRRREGREEAGEKKVATNVLNGSDQD